MNRITITLCACCCFLLTCQTSVPGDLQKNEYNLIPLPAQIEAASGQFQISDQVRIFSEESNNDFTNVASFLQKEIAERSGLKLSIAKDAAKKDLIVIRKNEAITNKEGYKLSVNPYDILIEAAEPAGAFYAVQTLLQLYSKNKGQSSFACVNITDSPRYPYRGMHLDVARHFFPSSFIKKYIDLMAIHKLNTFHWHLTEDQGWRIEIKKYPKLQEVAAFRKETLVGHYSDQPHQFDGKRHGGFYTQEEVKEIVAYAKERFITVIPEIELPGHSQAAIAAYPELGCTGKPTEVATLWGVFEDVYCPTEETFTFLENVLLEVMTLFPSEYIHIGGDECPKAAWEKSAFCQQLIKKEGLKNEEGLQSYFISRIEKFLNKNGKQIIGWDEILEGGLAPNATVMSWRGMKGGIEAARQNHDVIMTPTSHCYFDYYQSNSGEEPLAIGGFLPLKKVYLFEPTPEELTAEEAKHILGAQGNVWTEYMKTEQQVEYMAFPRAIALAEVNWSPKSKRNYDDFAKRLGLHLPKLDRLKVNYANHLFEVNTNIAPKVDGTDGVLVSLSTLTPDGKIYYSLDGSSPNQKSTLYEKPISLNGDAKLKAVCYKNEKAVSSITQSNFLLHKATAKNINLTNAPHPSYNMGGAAAMVNGIVGSDERYGDGEWLGWSGEDFEATIDLGKTQDINKISLRFYNGNGQWIYLPKKVTISSSSDGKNFTDILTKKLQNTSSKKVVDLNLNFPKTNTQHLKIRAERYGVIEDGKQGAGHEAWLFVDEIVVRSK
ncbi:MAG: hexosaminidase [Gammaproteobacteria bacterium]|jgi:hexosaminidase